MLAFLLPGQSMSSHGYRRGAAPHVAFRRARDCKSHFIDGKLMAAEGGVRRLPLTPTSLHGGDTVVLYARTLRPRSRNAIAMPILESA
jgi:hypothetical protein